MKNNKNNRNNQSKRKVRKEDLQFQNYGHFRHEGVTTVYIGNLKYEKTEKSLIKLFKRFGEVSHIKLMLDKDTMRSKGIAFVQMPDRQAALDAVAKLNGSDYEGRTIKVSIARNNVSQDFKANRANRVSRSEDRRSEEEVEPTGPKKRIPRKKKTSGLDRLFDYLKQK